MKIKFHSDPGHGWLEVPLTEIRKLNIHLKISPYSYLSRDGRMVYLEEDCDANTFVESLEKTGEKIEFEDISHNNLCFIRNLPHYPNATYVSHF